MIIQAAHDSAAFVCQLPYMSQFFKLSCLYLFHFDTMALYAN